LFGVVMVLGFLLSLCFFRSIDLVSDALGFLLKLLRCNFFSSLNEKRALHVLKKLAHVHITAWHLHSTPIFRKNWSLPVRPSSKGTWGPVSSHEGRSPTRHRSGVLVQLVAEAAGPGEEVREGSRWEGI
jgi:hypothetical protein